MIKTKKNYILQEVGGEYLVIPVGDASEEFKGILTLNDTAAIYWKEVEKGTTFDNLVTFAMEKFDDIDVETAKQDIKDFLDEISFATEMI